MAKLAPTSKKILEESLALAGLNENQTALIMQKVENYVRNILWDKEKGND